MVSWTHDELGVETDPLIEISKEVKMPEDFEIAEAIQCYNESWMEEYLEFLETDEKWDDAQINLNLASVYF